MDTKELYKPFASKKKGKKGSVYVMKNGKKTLIHFGDSSMGDFSLGASQARRKSYLARSAKIRDGQGNLTYRNRDSANFWSRKVNW